MPTCPPGQTTTRSNVNPGRLELGGQLLLLITSSSSLGSPVLVGLFSAQLSLRRFQSASGNGLVLIALNSIAFILFTPAL